LLYIIDEKGKGHGALAEFGVTHGVNGEKSITGTIYTNEEVIHGIDRGWKLRFDGETYAFIYAKPVDLGDVVQVEFDAVHSFFYDFSKSTKDEQLKDGSHTMQAYLDFIFKDSGYSFRLDTQVNAFEKQGFGYKNRLALFNDVISSAGVEFSVNGSVVRIIDRVGNDLSTVVRKGFNLNDLTIEKNIGDFITAQKGFGAWKNAEDHSKGRLEVEYISPLVDIYGRLDADPVVDERYTNANSLKARLENNVEGSYSISVALDMADLTKAGYEYKQPQEGDYIMAINEDLGFKRKIRIVSYTSKYDTSGELIDHSITANSLGMVQEAISGQSKVQNSINELRDEIAQTRREVTEVRVSADGKTNNYWSNKAPSPQEYKLNIGDTWYDTSGEDVVIYGWNGVEWRRVSFDKTAFERQFAEIEKQTQEMTTSIAEADTKAKSALDKVGVADNLLDEHQKMIASLNGQLAEDLVTDQTVTNHKTWLTNYGELVSNSGYDTTDYLPVSKGDLLSLESTVSHYYKLAFYDTDKNNLGYYDGSKVVLTPSGTAYFGNTGTFNAPADGFVRLSYSTATGGADTVKLSNQNNLYTLINSGYNNALSALSNANRAMQEFGENLISLDSLNRGYWLNAQGKLMENAPYKTTDYIRVDGGERYKLTGGNAVYQVYFYDANRDAIAYYDGKSIKEDVGTGYKYFTATPNVELIMPSNASYVRIASSIADFSQISFRKLSTVIANMFDAVDGMKQSVENDLSTVRNTANEAFEKASQNGGKLALVEQTVDDLKGEIINKVTGADVSTALNQFSETVKIQTASQITESLTGYAKSSEAEHYAKTYAVEEAGKVRQELTSYAKTGDLTTLAQNIRTETAESLKSVYTKTETDGLLGGKVSQATYESGIKGVRESVTTLEGSIKDLSSARNLLKDSWHNSEDSPSIVNTEYRIATWWLTKPLEVGKTYTFRLFGFSNREHFMLYTPNGLVRMGDFMGNGTANVIRTDTTYNALKNRRVWEISFTATQYTINNMTENRVSLFNYPSSSSSNGEIYWATLVEGTVGIDWQPAISDMLGTKEFSLFKRDYEATDKLVQETLTAIKSDTGSLSTRINDVKSTADGNKTIISNVQSTLVNKADKSELSKYATTTSLNQVKQTADGNEALIAKIQETPTSYLADYQKLINRANLVERTLGTTDSAVGENVSRMVQTSQMFQTEVIERTNLLAGMASGTGMTDDPYFDKGNNSISIYDNGKTDTITMLRESPTTSGQPYGKWRLRLNHGTSSATAPNRGGIAKSTTSWANGTVVIKFVAYLPTGRSFAYNQNGLGNGWSSGWLTDNKGTGKWETYAYYYRFGTSGTFSTFGHLSVTGSSSAFTWYLSEYDIINVNETAASKITQLADNINLKVSKGDISNQININTQGVVIQGNKIALSGQTSVDGAFWAKEVNAIKVNADNITTGTLDGSRIRANSIDTNRLTGNISEFIRTNWNAAVGGGVDISGLGVRSIDKSGSRVTMENGVLSVGNHAGVNLGFFGGHLLNPDATGTMTMTASLGTELAFLSATSADGRTYKRAMSIASGASEIDMFSTLDMNQNPIRNAENIGFNGGEIRARRSGNAGYMTFDTITGHAFSVSGTDRMSITSVVHIWSGIDMHGKDLANVGKLTYNSDERLKTNIKETNIKALEAISRWRLVEYDWRKSGEHVDIGLIAQNTPEIMIYNEENDIYGIDAGKQTMINTLAIQQLNTKVDDKVVQLEHKIASLQDELAQLKGA
ncbi:phage tail protein, partial [Aerococcus urinaeequi]